MLHLIDQKSNIKVIVKYFYNLNKMYILNVIYSWLSWTFSIISKIRIKVLISLNKNLTDPKLLNCSVYTNYIFFYILTNTIYILLLKLHNSTIMPNIACFIHVGNFVHSVLHLYKNTQVTACPLKNIYSKSTSPSCNCTKSNSQMWFDSL